MALVPSRRTRGLTSALAAALLMVIAAAPAWAHVTITPAAVPRAATETLTVHVPNERDGHRTVRIELDLPAGVSLSGGRVPPVAGWLVAARTAASGMVRVVWTAVEGGGIGTDASATFPLIVTTPPTPGLLIFKALQTYDDGVVVRWIEPPNPDGSPAPRPYPTVLVTGPDGVAPTTTTGPAVPPAPSHRSASKVPVVAVALVAAAAAAAALGWAWRRWHRPQVAGRDAR